MSTIQNIEILEDIQADFDLALAEKNWKEAEGTIQQVGEMKEEMAALRMRHALNKAIGDFEFIPFEHEIPVITEFEAHTWGLNQPTSKHESEYETVADEDGQSITKII